MPSITDIKWLQSVSPSSGLADGAASPADPQKSTSTPSEKIVPFCPGW